MMPGPRKGHSPMRIHTDVLNLPETGTLRLVDSSGTVLWANKTAATRRGVTISGSGIFSSLGGVVNGLEAIGGCVLQLGESAFGIGWLTPGGGSLASIPGLSDWETFKDSQASSAISQAASEGDLGGLTGKLGDLTQGVLGKLGV